MSWTYSGGASSNSGYYALNSSSFGNAVAELSTPLSLGGFIVHGGQYLNTTQPTSTVTWTGSGTWSYTFFTGDTTIYNVLSFTNNGTGYYVDFTNIGWTMNCYGNGFNTTFNIYGWDTLVGSWILLFQDSTYSGHSVVVSSKGKITFGQPRHITNFGYQLVSGTNNLSGTTWTIPTGSFAVDNYVSDTPTYTMSVGDKTTANRVAVRYANLPTTLGSKLYFNYSNVDITSCNVTFPSISTSNDVAMKVTGSNCKVYWNNSLLMNYFASSNFNFGSSTSVKWSASNINYAFVSRLYNPTVQNAVYSSNVVQVTNTLWATEIRENGVTLSNKYMTNTAFSNLTQSNMTACNITACNVTVGGTLASANVSTGGLLTLSASNVYVNSNLSISGTVGVVGTTTLNGTTITTLTATSATLYSGDAGCVGFNSTSATANKPLYIADCVVMQDNVLWLRQSGNNSNGLQYNSTVDGCRLFGRSGGYLGTWNGNNAIQWNSAGNTTLNGTLTVYGNTSIVGTISPYAVSLTGGSFNMYGGTSFSEGANLDIYPKGGITYHHGTILLPSGTGSIGTISDSNLKKNIVVADLDRCEEIVRNLPLKYYEWDKSKKCTQEINHENHQLGWIAQEVQKFFPNSVQEHDFDGETHLVMEQSQIVAAMYGALQKALLKIDDLEKIVSKK